MTAMSEQEFLSRVGRGRCAPDIMAEGLNDFLCSLGLYDAARCVGDWISDWITLQAEIGYSKDFGPEESRLEALLLAVEKTLANAEDHAFAIQTALKQIGEAVDGNC
jgi:hypothetical protein